LVGAPRFKKLGLPTDIAVDYLDSIVALVPGAFRKEVPHEKDLKSEAVFYGKNGGECLRFAQIASRRGEWFEAIDRAIGRIREMRGDE
jgi:hypothetical protein